MEPSWKGFCLRFEGVGLADSLPFASFQGLGREGGRSQVHVSNSSGTLQVFLQPRLPQGFRNASQGFRQALPRLPPKALRLPPKAPQASQESLPLGRFPRASLVFPLLRIRNLKLPQACARLPQQEKLEGEGGTASINSVPAAGVCYCEGANLQVPALAAFIIQNTFKHKHGFRGTPRLPSTRQATPLLPGPKTLSGCRAKRSKTLSL